MIGVIAGLGAVVFYEALRGATRLFLDIAASYRPPDPAGEGGFDGTGHFAHWWLIPVIVAVGGLISGVLVFRLAPEAEGHGTDAAIDAVHRNPRMIRARAVVVKIVASAITIGSGGSGGREGPTAQISAGFGSLLARGLDLSPEDGRVAVSVGIGSGIGAIFGAPLGGAVLAADIVYRDDFEAEALVPGFIASIAGYTVFGLIEGFSPLFGYAAPGYRFHEPVQLAWFAVIGVLAGLVGLIYARSFYGIVALSARLPMSKALRPALGGLLVGLLALAVPEVLGTGYGWVQQGLQRDDLLALPLWIVLVLPLAKILATALSIGTGGSGGIFGPGMVIGGFVGSAVWRVLEPIGTGVPHSPAPFVIVGMMACFGSIARAPLAMMLMVAEMTGSLTILPPAMIAVGLAYLIARRTDETIYRSQLRNREEAQSARLRLGLPLLGRVRVSRAMSAPRLVLPGGTRAAEALPRLERAAVPGAPVVDAEGRFLGTVDRAGLRAMDADAEVARSVDASAPSVPGDTGLDVAIDALPEGHPWLTVLDGRRQVRGILAISDVVRAYHAAVRAEARRTPRPGVTDGIEEIPVDERSGLVGRTLADADLPEGTIVLSIRRGDSLLTGAGGARLEAGDLVTVVARPERMALVRRRLSPAPPVTGADGDGSPGVRPQ
jgi:H+/Cl- antiporter ClcA